MSGEKDVTTEFLKNEEDYVAMFKWLNDRKSVKQDQFLAYLKLNKKTAAEYRWNYVEDKEYPCNETRSQILSFLSKANINSDFLTNELAEKLWHLLYSVEDKVELIKGLTKFAKNNNLDASFVESFKKFPPYKKEYGAYSLKAIKKLLPLMRMGEYWSEEAIDAKTRQRIDRILTGEYDETIKTRVREKAVKFDCIQSFRALPVWLACYIVYDRHSEVKEVLKWNSPAELKQYIDSFKQHSLRNPIVEQVITETLRTVRDIWTQYGDIDEIHVELGREMKNPAYKREKITQQISDNENANLRIKAMLLEFANPEFGVENVRPNSPSQQEILRIYEEAVINSVEKLPKEIEDILKKFKETDIEKRPSKKEVMKYKLWLEQKYRSPYTGESIPLAKLFTPAYEIEHIIPKARYFDDSLSNKVICESEINKLKRCQLGMEFVENSHGQKVELSFGKVVTVFTVAEYEQFVKDTYGRNRNKMRKLLMKDIPEEFIARQLVDTQYIGKVVKGLLSNIVREEGETEAISKNVIVCTGGVIDRLKKDWGINDVWNKIILPRFIRLNGITGTQDFTAKTNNNHVIPSMPLALQKGFSKKRIDHRHHAMDAIVIACASRNIVNYLNNESASAKAKISRIDLQHLLCDKVTGENGYSWIIRKPWDTFTQDVYSALSQVVVSFKQNLRVINKATNVYTHYENGRKTQVVQKGVNWAIRKSMHTDTYYGEINLRKIKAVELSEVVKNPERIVDKDLKRKIVSLLGSDYDTSKIKEYFEQNKEVWQDVNLSKIQVYYFTKETNSKYFATRKPLDTSFDKKKILKHVTDTGIQKILLRHLELNDDNPEKAFSPDGIDEMNRTIVELNGGKFHQPIYKVRFYENSTHKFAVGGKGNKSSKFVEADKGTNLFFAVYENEIVNKTTGEIERQRSFATIPLNVVIERLKQGLSAVPNDENGKEPIFVLSPNDLVYVPSDDEIRAKKNVSLSCDRIYKMVSANKSQCFFIQSNVANLIVSKVEFSKANKMERALSGEMIKEICIPIKVDRLGNILK